MPNDSRCIISFPSGSNFGILLFSKTQKAPGLGDLPSMVTDLPPSSSYAAGIAVAWRCLGFPELVKICRKTKQIFQNGFLLSGSDTVLISSGCKWDNNVVKLQYL